MEREQHPEPGGEQPQEVNSYGTDDPAVQARIEQARIDASKERQRDRARLEQLVEQGMRPDDAEALIEFEHFTQNQREQTAGTQRATEQAVAAADSEPTSIDATRRDLTDLLALRKRPDGAAALVEFTAATRRNAGTGAAKMPTDPAAVAKYQAAGLDRRDALTVAGFEYFLREKLRAAGDPAADMGSEQREHVVRFHPRVHVAVDEPGISHGAWIEAAQSAEELDAAISTMLEGSPVPGARRWKVTGVEDFAGLPVLGSRDTDLLSRLGRGVADHGVAFAAWVDVQGVDDRDMLDRFEDFYVGRYGDEQEWAESIAVDMEWLDQLDEVVDPTLRPYVGLNYDKIAREARAGWDVVTGLDGRVYVFMR